MGPAVELDGYHKGAVGEETRGEDRGVTRRDQGVAQPIRAAVGKGMTGVAGTGLKDREVVWPGPEWKIWGAVRTRRRGPASGGARSATGSWEVSGRGGGWGRGA